MSRVMIQISAQLQSGNNWIMQTKLHTFSFVAVSLSSAIVSNILVFEMLLAPKIFKTFCGVSGSCSRPLFSADRK